MTRKKQPTKAAVETQPPRRRLCCDSDPMVGHLPTCATAIAMQADEAKVMESISTPPQIRSGNEPERPGTTAVEEPIAGIASDDDGQLHPVRIVFTKPAHSVVLENISYRSGTCSTCGGAVETGKPCPTDGQIGGT